MGIKYADIKGHLRDPVSCPIFPTAHTPKNAPTIKRYLVNIMWLVLNNILKTNQQNLMEISS